MEQIHLVYGIFKETVTALMMLYKNLKAVVCFPDGHFVFFGILSLKSCKEIH